MPICLQASGIGHRALYAVSANQIVCGGYLFTCSDFGTYWPEVDFIPSTIKKADLGMFLSLTLSRFPLLTVDIEAGETLNTRPRSLRPAIIFQEVDAYNYLHLQPVFSLDGYPPGFFEEQDIIKIAEYDPRERQLRISEVIYADSPHELGGCLADDMGLGKTIQVIALLRALYQNGSYGPSLIICPRSLLYNWQQEIQRFAPELTVDLYYGPGRKKSGISQDYNGLILSTYGTIRKDIEDLTDIQFSSIILDESQAIKNINARASIAVLSLKGSHRLALSGTPVENHLGELYSLFRFLNPTFFGSHAQFMKSYVRPIQDGQDMDALQDLKTRIYPFILRRLKRDVLKELPEKTEQMVLIELDTAHLATYHRRRQSLAAEIQRAMQKDGMAKSMFMILTAMTELRRLASIPEADAEYGGVSAKREYLLEMISEISEIGHKSLIFTNHLTAVDLISEDLSSRGIGNLVMTGATSGRQELVQRFQNDPEIKAFVMTLKTGGTGLNLTAADYVFIVDPWLNQAAENQAIDRTHRIGQVNPVFCYRMIAKETIEEKILELQQRKSQLTSSLFSADTEAVKNLTEEDIAFLME